MQSIENPRRTATIPPTAPANTGSDIPCPAMVKMLGGSAGALGFVDGTGEADGARVVGRLGAEVGIDVVDGFGVAGVGAEQVPGGGGVYTLIVEEYKSNKV